MERYEVPLERAKKKLESFGYGVFIDKITSQRHGYWVCVSIKFCGSETIVDFHNTSALAIGNQRHLYSYVVEQAQKHIFRKIINNAHWSHIDNG